MKIPSYFSNSHFDPHPVEDGRKCPVLKEGIGLSRIAIETIPNKLGQNFHNENCCSYLFGFDTNIAIMLGSRLTVLAKNFLVIGRSMSGC